MKKLLLFGLIFQSALQGAAFPADATISNLEVTIEKAISARSPVAGIIDNLERLAILYDAKGDALGQLQALRRISTLKGISKDKKMVNDVRVGNMFKELEARLKVQAGQTADMRRHYEAQIALGRLYHLRNDPGDSVKAEILFKAAVAQQEYPELRSQAYVALGDLNLSSQTPKGIAYAMEYYRLVPKEDSAWPLAQAKLGVLLMQQGAENAKEVLANGVSVLDQATTSLQDRTKAKMLAAEHLSFQQNWQDAAKFYVEVAKETLSAKERLQANLNAAILLQRNQPKLAPIYFKRVYDELPIKDMDADTQLFARITAARELAALGLANVQNPAEVINYVQAALSGAQELTGSLLKNKKLLNNTQRVVRNFLTGGFSLDTVLRNAESKIGENKLYADALDKLAADFEALDNRLEKIEAEQGLEL